MGGLLQAVTMALFGLQGTYGPAVTIRGDREMRELLEQGPKIANRELNTAFAVAGGLFFRAFLPQLTGAGVKVRRRARKRGAGGGGPRVAVPAKARAAGFKGEVQGVKVLQGKALSLRTRNPVMVAHEFGAVIRPKRGRGLKLPVRTRAEAARTAQPGRKLPFFVLVRQVRIKPKLGFHATWERVQSQILARLDKAAARIAERVNRQDTSGAEAGGGEDAGL